MIGVPLNKSAHYGVNIKMNDDSFARLVAEEIKNNASDQQRDYLRLPENWSRWYRAVKSLSDNLDSQLKIIHDSNEEEVARYLKLGDDGTKLIAETTAEFENRRKKIERFKFHVTTRLDEVSRMIALGTDAVEERLKTVEFLRKSIERHHELMATYDMEATPIDIALWSALDGKWKFEEITDDTISDYLAK